MVIVKLTILALIVTVILLTLFKGWCISHPLEAMIEYYPWWAYVMGILVILDVIGVVASAIWLLFIYW